MKFTAMFMLFVAMMVVAPIIAVGGEVLKKETITIVGGSSNTVVDVNMFNAGVGQPQSSELVKFVFEDTNAGTTTKVAFATMDSSVVSSDLYTSGWVDGAGSYVNDTPFKMFVTGVGGASSTNFSYTPYTVNKLRVRVWQNATNTASTVTTYKIWAYGK